MADHISLVHVRAGESARYSGRQDAGFAEFQVSHDGNVLSVYDDDPSRLAAGLRAAADVIDPPRRR